MSNFTLIIISQLEAIVERNRKAYIARQEKLQELYKEENENIAPTLDRHGRLHAPCRGYRIPDSIQNLYDFSDDYSERIFEKGNYLPVPINDEFSFFYANSPEFSQYESFRIEGDMIQEFKNLEEKAKELFLPISFKYSRVWQYNDVDCCYVTVKSIWKSVINSVKEQMTIIQEAERIEKAAKIAEEKANKGVAPEGRHVVHGKVTNIKREDSIYGSVWKMTVLLDNKSTVFGSIPQNILDIEHGDLVSFTATFNHAKDDNTHSFFKRPSKATFESAKVTA